MVEKNKPKEKKSAAAENLARRRKRSTLQRYYDEGVLELSDSRFAAADRKNAGEILLLDYYLGNYDSRQTARLFLCKIPTTGEYGRDQALFYKERYLRAIKNIPSEFWMAVRRVCIDDLPLKSNYPEQHAMLRKYDVYHQKKLLNMGLDRLIQFYYRCE